MIAFLRVSEGESELGMRWVGEGGDSDAEKAEWAGDEAVAGEEVAGEAVDFGGGDDGFFEADLAGEGGEVGVTDFDLDGERAEAVSFECESDVV